MKGLYILLAAVFIMLMISPAAYSTESSNLSMGYLKEMDPNVTLIYEAANLSDFKPLDEGIVVWDFAVSEATIVEPSDEELKALEAEEPKHPYILRFVGGSFTPTERLDVRIQNKLPSIDEEDYTYCFVMISGITTGAKRDALIDHGVKLLGYHQHHSYAAKIPLNRIEELVNLSFVRWIGYAPSDLKIHPTLKKKISSGSDDEIRVYISVVDSDLNEYSEKTVHGGETQYDGKRQYVTKQYYTYIPHGPFQNKLEAMGATILFYDDGRKTFTARVAHETINEIADLDFVLFIEPNDLTADLTMELMSNQRSPNTDEPSEQEEMTTGDSNPGIVTIIRMAFACIQRRLI